MFLSLVFISSFVSSVTFAFPQTTNSSRALSTQEKPYFAVSDENVLRAHCQRSKPPTIEEMRVWLNQWARAKADRGGKTESPSLTRAIELLMLNQSWNEISQQADIDQNGRVSLQLLYMLARYGFNGSPLALKNADPWTTQELDTVLLSLSDLPTFLLARPMPAMNHPLVHRNRSESAEGPLANAVIYIFNRWNKQTSSMQRYSLYHELGHNMGFDFGLDDSIAWFRAADWGEKDSEWVTMHPERKVSRYAETNPYEDFAESFAAYRYNPQGLKQAAPKIYEYMKARVYRGVEYTSESACRNNSAL